MLKSLLRGLGQVMFQNHAGSGLLFFAAIVAGTPITIWIAAFFCLLIATLATPGGQREQGLGGYNGVLVGMALATFLAPNPILLLLGALATPPTMRAISRLCAALQLSALTAPFVLVSWVLLLAAHQFTALNPAAASTSVPLTLSFWPTAILQGISQVFLVQNPISGALFLAGLALNSRWAAGLALAGSTIGAVLALMVGAPATAIEAGLYGFSPLLTAIALGCTFYAPTIKNLSYTALATIFTVFTQAACNAALEPLSLPALTAPFVMATWIFQLGHPSLEPTMPEKVKTLSSATETSFEHGLVNEPEHSDKTT